MTGLLSAFLPAAMMILMLSLGLGMRPRDIAGAVRAPRALATGLAVQMIGLPLAAVVIGHAAGLDPLLTAGLVLVAASPGGVTSNYVTLLAGGVVGLSVAMTLVTSLAAPLTLPLVLGLAGVEGPAAGGLWRISLGMTAVALAPLVIGMALAGFVPAFAARVEKLLTPVARAMFILMVLATFAQNWGAMGEAFARVGWAVTLFAIAAPVLAILAAAAARLNAARSRTIMVEATMQNVAITIFVASTLLDAPALAIPGLIYAVEMNIAALVIIGAARMVETRRGANSVT
ncbi:bile acid:sodium symporter family protein [Maritimibacter sp. HL-12]|uniref:bile acid:sodium symporter family protein n=1 Tax=Maritimibacter sp. HL-12 TaxID=1162418 RepID=UPI000A0F28F8|nr:bile acid:sodium symporter [Maritimibacter sp. HL-12]SMH47336.1 bile acid:Na+ symporter, BASS family [Maritimibacter sp. HL-12]